MENIYETTPMEFEYDSESSILLEKLKIAEVNLNILDIEIKKIAF